MRTWWERCWHNGCEVDILPIAKLKKNPAFSKGKSLFFLYIQVYSYLKSLNYTRQICQLFFMNENKMSSHERIDSSQIYLCVTVYHSPSVDTSGPGPVSTGNDFTLKKPLTSFSEHFSLMSADCCWDTKTISVHFKSHLTLTWHPLSHGDIPPPPWFQILIITLQR